SLQTAERAILSRAMPPATIEQRRDPRRDSSAALRLSGAELDLIDLSARGFAVKAPRALAVGETVPFDLQLPGAGNVTGLARVRWQQPTGRNYAHGFEIVDIRPWTRH